MITLFTTKFVRIPLFFVALRIEISKNMAKKKNRASETESIWKEGDLIETFYLKPIREYTTPLMQDWLMRLCLPLIWLNKSYLTAKSNVP